VITLKLAFLIGALPENLRYINIFQFKDDWSKCSIYVKDIIPEIISSNNIESNNIKNNTKNIFSAENKTPQDLQERSKTRKSFKQNKNTIKNGRCNYCLKKGHFFYECRKRRQNRMKRKNSKKFNYKKYNNKHYKNKYYINSANKNNYDNLYSEAFTQDFNDNETLGLNLVTNNNQSTTSKKKLTCWILDSGASIHITNQLDNLFNIKICNEKIFLANKQSIHSTFIGTFKGYINDYEIIINDVYFSPNIDKNLLSIGKLIKQNYKLIFNSNQNKPYVSIYDKYQNKIIDIFSNSSNTFKIWISTQPILLNNISQRNIINQLNYTNLKISEKLNLWHRRFAHF